MQPSLVATMLQPHMRPDEGQMSVELAPLLVGSDFFVGLMLHRNSIVMLWFRRATIGA